MCYNLIMYYPRHPTFKDCFSTPETNYSQKFYSDLNNNIDLYQKNLSLLLNEFANYYNNMTSVVSCGNVSFQLNLLVLNFDYKILCCCFFCFSKKDDFIIGPIRPSNIYIEPNPCSAPKPMTPTLLDKIKQIFQDFFKFIFGWRIF